MALLPLASQPSRHFLLLLTRHVPSHVCAAGPSHKNLKTAALQWFEEHKTATIVGGAVLGGIIGVAVASAAIAVASSRGTRR